MPTIFLAGDSTCSNKDSRKYPEAGWGHFLNEHVAEGWAVENFAINGRSTKSFIDEGRFAAILAILKPGDWVCIQFGHNDQKKEDPARYADAEGAYACNLRSMATQARAKGATVVILSSISRRIFLADGSLEQNLAPYPQVAARTAQELGAHFIDANRLSSEWLLSLGDKASIPFFMHLEPGAFPGYPDGKADNTHLRVEGAKAVCAMIAAEGRKLGLEPFQK